jgi:hypothetical protein
MFRNELCLMGIRYPIRKRWSCTRERLTFIYIPEALNPRVRPAPRGENSLTQTLNFCQPATYTQNLVIKGETLAW